MIRRFLFVVFFALGGFLFYIPKWILVGTRGSRDRKKMIKLQKQQNKILRQQKK
jgi:hypothetical protein